MYFNVYMSLLATCIITCTAQVSDAEALLVDMKTVDIFDSVSVSLPFELRERGKITYSALNHSASFSESGIHSVPHNGAEIYRIGTEEHLAFAQVSNIESAADANLDETLTLYLDLQGDVYHTSYTMRSTSTRPGSFLVKLHSMADFPGPEVLLKSKVAKTSDKSDVKTDAADITEEVEEDQPPQTYLQKYWIFAIPFVLLAIMGGAGGSE